MKNKTQNFWEFTVINDQKQQKKSHVLNSLEKIGETKMAVRMAAVSSAVNKNQN